METLTATKLYAHIIINEAVFYIVLTALSFRMEVLSFCRVARRSVPELEKLEKSWRAEERLSAGALAAHLRIIAVSCPVMTADASHPQILLGGTFHWLIIFVMNYWYTNLSARHLCLLSSFLRDRWLVSVKVIRCSPRKTLTTHISSSRFKWSDLVPR